MNQARSTSYEGHVGTAPLRANVSRRTWRERICGLLTIWFVLLSGPVAIAHGATQSSLTSLEVVIALTDGAGRHQPVPAEEGATRHCAVCQLSQALPARTVTAPYKQIFTGIVYAAPEATDASEFAPPPLRKPPRA